MILLDHYREFSLYTNPGLYKPMLKKLPNNVRKTGDLVRAQIIHRFTLYHGNTGTNADLKFGDMAKVPWHRQLEDDVLVSASAMLAELYRRDRRGFTAGRKEKNKLVLTCRHVAILMAAILKSKGIPCRVRAGHASYFDFAKKHNISVDHWINQYWNKTEKRWVSIDVDGSWSMNGEFDLYDLPEGVFDFPAEAWLRIRDERENPKKFWNASSRRGALVVAWSLFYDFHCLMNNEVPYVHVPAMVQAKNFRKLSEKELKEIDALARRLVDPDKNFGKLQYIWNTNKKFRLLSGGLLG